MSKKMIKLGICIILAAGLLGAYLYLQKEPDEQATSISEEAPESETYSLLDRGMEEIKQFTLSSGKEKLVLVPVPPVEEGGEFTCRLEAFPELVLDSNIISGLSRGVTAVSADKRLTEKADNPAEYGLQSPQAELQIIYTDGSTRKISLGDMTPDKEYYYAMVDGDTAVYLLSVSTGEKYAYALDDLVNKSLPSITLEELQYVYVENSDGAVLEVGDSYEMKQPYPGRDVYPDNLVGKVLTGFDNFSFDKLVEVEAQDLAKYGLTEPELIIRLRDGENSIGLLVSRSGGDDNVYVCKAGENTVFSVSAAAFDKVSKIDVFGFIDRFVALKNIQDVDKIIIDEAGKKTEMLLNAETLPLKEGETEGEKIYKPTVNGKEVDEDAFKAYYRTLISIAFDSEIKDFSPSTPPDITVSFYMNDGTGVFINEYYRYNDNFYVVKINDEPFCFAVPKRDIEAERKESSKFEL